MKSDVHEGATRHVVLVDTYASIGTELAQGFLSAGYTPLRVQSSPEVPEALRGQPDRYPYDVDIVHHGDLHATLQALSPFRPVAVVAGTEPGVELADALSEALHPITGAPTNGTALSSARRDKYLMIERIKQQGLRGARQILVETERQLRDWHTEVRGMVVLKPLRSAAGDGVAWCHTPDDSVQAFRRLDGRKNVLSQPNDGVVAQECLMGTEYIVDTVSRDGAHHVCDIWETYRINANGVPDLLVAWRLLPATGEVQDKLVAYAFAVLDALGIRHGAAHAEIKMTSDGPCLVEVGARIAGGTLPEGALLATGRSQVEWTVDAYARPGQFAENSGRPYRLRQQVAGAAMVAPRSGTLTSYQSLEAIKGLDSFHDMRVRVNPGEQLSLTTNDLTYPIFVRLVHEVGEVVARDLWTLRYIDGPGFYELA
ncbi:ATP-grasp domain-containing protein [Mycobacterium seoulense]|uniref:ATP-grasp domain-containing protein n=1 Tax=Mycobacterium seoulense TaxID=386911 RepID=A0A7I7P4L6_9MYCO|nr:ATP-grasp domain-containing protein [Mycobacterium seoulense]MCV7438767.1 ATP-grasp domain-containing protein [Mycobacterium seoulense]BBY03821.1 ATP-grasp domain-containing protein [Mycobacterium seoulense]